MINQPQQVDPLTGMPIEQALPVQQQAQLSQAGRPHGKGSSSGKDGMKLKLEQPIYKAGPITQRAK